MLVGAQAYREQYGTNAVFLLPTNLYGPRDNFDLQTSHVIPALIRKMIESPEEIVLWGDGTPSREYLYVEDCAEGVLLAAERYDGAEPVNLGTGVETTIRETAELVAELAGFSGEIVWDESMPNGQPRRSLDASAREGAVRLRGKDAAARGSGAHDRVVSGAGARACRSLNGEGAVALRHLPAARLRHAAVDRPRPADRRPVARLLALALTVRHNSWLYYQGGDQTYYCTDGWMMSQWTLPDGGGRLGLVVRADPRSRAARAQRPLGAARA